MYFVKYGKNYLHDPRVDGYQLLDLSLDCEENSCGYCDFTIYSNHPMYNKLKERDPDNLIEVYDGDTIIFCGFIYELGKEFYLDGHVKCKGELDYLNESIVRPYSTSERGYGGKAPNTINGYFEWLINKHNEQVNKNKRFTIGVNQGSMLTSSNYISTKNDSYPSTIDEISEKLINNENIGGYLRIRYEKGIKYIDYLSTYVKDSNQILDFGTNLTDYTQTDDSVDISTFVIPTGSSMNQTNYSFVDGYFATSDTTVNKNKTYYLKNNVYLSYSGLTYFDSLETYYEYNETTQVYSITTDITPTSGKTYYTLKNNYSYNQCYNLTAFETGYTYYEYNSINDESNLPLTIKNIDGIEFKDSDYGIIDDYVYSKSAVKKYGLIGKVYNDSSITTKEDLINVGISYLKNIISPKRTIEIKAVDMHFINPKIDFIKIGEYIRVRSVPHELDSYFPCKKIELDLNNPQNSIYTLGISYDTLTGQQDKKINELNAEINKNYEKSEKLSDDVKQNSIILEGIKNNFDNLYIGGTNLYLGTRNFDGTSWKNLDNWVNQNSTGDFVEYGRTGSGMGIYQELYLTGGRTYTFSFESAVESGSTANINILTSLSSDVLTNPSSISIGSISNSDYIRYSGTFKTINDKIVYVRVENTEETFIKIRKLKLEIGNIVTDWSPSPDDSLILLSEQDAAVCELYENSLSQQEETDSAICALYESSIT